MPAQKEDRAKPSTRPDFEDMARAVHASYLSRWARHKEDDEDDEGRRSRRRHEEKVSA